MMGFRKNYPSSGSIRMVTTFTGFPAGQGVCVWANLSGVWRALAYTQTEAELSWLPASVGQFVGQQKPWICLNTLCLHDRISFSSVTGLRCHFQGKTYNSPLMNWLQIAISSFERWFGTGHNNVLPVCGHSVLQVASWLLLVWSSDLAASMCFHLANFIFRTGKKLASCCSKF